MRPLCRAGYRVRYFLGTDRITSILSSIEKWHVVRFQISISKELTRQSQCSNKYIWNAQRRAELSAHILIWGALAQTLHAHTYETRARTYSMRREHTHTNSPRTYSYETRAHTHNTLKMKTRSKVWVHFSGFDANSPRCSICGKIIAAKTGNVTTTNMMKTLTVHGVNIRAEKQKVAPSSTGKWRDTLLITL